MRNRPPRLIDWLTSLLLLGGIAVSAAPRAADGPPKTVVRDLYYGEVLFQFYKQDDFTALTHLLAARDAGRVGHHEAESELLLGGLYLSYGQHDRAEGIFERLLKDTPTPSVRDRAWFYLGKLRYERGLYAEALASFAKNRARPARRARRRIADAGGPEPHGGRRLRRRPARARRLGCARQLACLRALQPRRRAGAPEPGGGRRGAAGSGRPHGCGHRRAEEPARQGQSRARLRLPAGQRRGPGEAGAGARAPARAVREQGAARRRLGRCDQRRLSAARWCPGSN